MISTALSVAVLSAVARTVVAQGTSVEPLVDRHYAYNQIPEQVDTNPTGRGPQFGFNICNSTTQGQNSDCQTALINSLDDFCLWGPATPDSTIADTEAATVAWCTKNTHGSRVIPSGALTGVQYLKAPAYQLVVGTIQQQLIDIQSGDDGGELDPHGADGRGNPLGGLVYSNGFPSNGGNNNSFQQVIEWHNFMGSNIFCFKICDPAVANSKVFCNNIYDETGCGFVAPAAYQEGVFEVCDSDNMDPVGVYTSNGQVLTYSQPAVVVTLPSIRTPASSNCVTYSSGSIYTAGSSISAPSNGTSSGTGSTTSGASSTGSASSGTGSITTKASTSSSGSTKPSSSPAPTTTKSAAAPRAQIGLGVVGAIAASIIAGLGAAVALL